jgi:predicted alpha/beta-fold hydrolase
LRGGQRQTLASYFLPRRIMLPPGEERMVEGEEGVCLRCVCHWQADRAARLTLLIVHGLEGSSDSGYVVGITQKALAAGMNVVRMNQRNCGGTDGWSPSLYHSGLSSDVRAVAEHLIAREGLTRLALAGYSMGGNLVLKLAGEWSTRAPVPVRAVAAVCPSIDLAPSADALHLPSNWLYEKYFLVKLSRRLREKAKLFPGKFDLARLQNLSSLRDFDDRITAYYCGFDGAADYYDRAAAARVISHIAVPTLILHALDDPFIRLLPATRALIRGNPHITFIETGHGGHCAFLAAPDGYDGRWAEKQVVEFLKRF